MSLVKVAVKHGLLGTSPTLDKNRQAMPPVRDESCNSSNDLSMDLPTSGQEAELSNATDALPTTANTQVTDVTIIPAMVHVHAALVEARTTNGTGLDLSQLDEYRWHPGPQAMNLGK